MTFGYIYVTIYKNDIYDMVSFNGKQIILVSLNIYAKYKFELDGNPSLSFILSITFGLLDKSYLKYFSTTVLANFWMDIACNPLWTSIL